MSKAISKPKKKKRSVRIDYPVTCYIEVTIETDETIEEIQKRLQTSSYPFYEYSDEIKESDVDWQSIRCEKGKIYITDIEKDDTTTFNLSNEPT